MKLWGVGALAFTLVAAAAGLMTASCSDSNLGTGQGDGGASGCPTNQPTNGSACLLANNTTCTYNTAQTPNCECCGGGTTFLCTSGKWEEEATAGAAGAGAGGAAPACPATVPEAGSPCTYGYGGCGAPAQQLCSYGCVQGGSQEAVCNGSAWTITTSGDCADDGGDDAGDGGDASDGG